MVAGAIFPALIATMQFFTNSGWWDKTIMANRIKGTFLHPATLSFYLLFTLPIIYALLLDRIKRHYKVIVLALLFFFASIILITLTRGAWFGMAIMILFYGAMRNKKFLVFIISLMFLSYIFFPTINERINDVFSPKYNSSLITRLKIVESTIPAIKKAPIFGNGFATFELIHLKYNEEAKTYESLQAHNDYLRLMIELGIVGLILYLCIFISLFNLIFNLYKKSDQINKNYLFSVILIWLGALAISAGDNILRTMEAQFLLWSFTGAVLALMSLEEKNTSLSFRTSEAKRKIA
jgi:O-antigen ligase